MKKFDYIISAVAFCFGLVIFYVTRNVEKFYNGNESVSEKSDYSYT